ncbi:hypothetical protein FSP39_025310 [Pinctada imbricata]|uniref:Uncharacterized protein n=1 Tax=Pinctada imbricata TaxID=66713 RepID=A0AA89C2L8_PINIB|nr:hypothetical protein FSP39_025310 [Pinctada imbricata]
MRVLWKRNLCGNLVALLLCVGLLAGYVALLRYNKASSVTFNIKPVKIPHRSIRDLRKKQWASAHGKKGNKSDLDVHIVEEHHEVLPIWMNAVSHGTIPKTGNTLIHIDGHSDMAIPFLVQGYPFFRLPRDSKEIIKMMQRNDVFIVQAGMAGLLKRIIWIWPRWVTDVENWHVVSTLKIGFAYVTVGEALREKVMCTCFSSKSKHESCEYITKNVASKNEQRVKPIHPKQCHSKRTIMFETLNEDAALKMLKDKSHWLSDKENVMLDIDEDYYGCTYASQSLVNNNVKVSVLEQMNNILRQLFCPKSAAAERDVDKLLHDILGKFLQSSNCHVQNKSVGGKTHKCRNDIQRAQSSKQIRNFLWGGLHSTACSKKTRELENLIMQLVELFFSHMNPKQIKALQQVGFCLSTTLNSYIPISDPEFSICMGNNNPKESVVHEHKPTRSEIANRTTILNRILETMKGPKTPKIITVSRSVRDGYTPRGFFRLIERNVIKCIGTSFPKTKFHFHDGLLGGKWGWPGRHSQKH